VKGGANKLCEQDEGPEAPGCLDGSAMLGNMTLSVRHMRARIEASWHLATTSRRWSPPRCRGGPDAWR